MDRLKKIKEIIGKQKDMTIKKEFLYYTSEVIHKFIELENNKKKKKEFDETAFISKYWKNSRNIYLDYKVNEFIDWYYKNMIKDNYTDIGEFRKPNDMRNFIEKMAVWYELRYPDYEINRLMHCASQEKTEINDVMFNNNTYVNELFDEDADIRDLEWDEFYNSNSFILSLPLDERYLFGRIKYKNLVYIDSYHSHAHLHLSSKGFVESADGFGDYTDFKVKDDELCGMYVKDVVKLLKEKGITLPRGNELEESIKAYENWNYQKDEMLNCVMYRIIERGGNRMGPRRAFLFAKEFGRNIDIPMMYGVDYSDPGLRSFINEYLKAGGKKDLNCFVGYFTRINNTNNLETVTIEELLKYVSNDCTTKYTKEETILYQSLVNVLSSQVNYDEIRKEEVKQLRLRKKLDKSRNNK